MMPMTFGPFGAVLLTMNVFADAPFATQPCIVCSPPAFFSGAFFSCAATDTENASAAAAAIPKTIRMIDPPPEELGLRLPSSQFFRHSRQESNASAAERQHASLRGGLFGRDTRIRDRQHQRRLTLHSPFVLAIAAAQRHHHQYRGLRFDSAHATALLEAFRARHR